MNLAGVEIILNMREKMAAMQDQIEAFVATLNQEFAHQARASAGAESRRSLIPVVQMRTPAVIEIPKKKRPKAN